MNTIEKLLKSVIDDAERHLSIKRIEKDVDLKLAEVMIEFLRDRDLKVGKTLATLCYVTALLMARSNPSEEEACSFIQEYGDYTHQVLHAIYRTDRGENPSDVENNT